MTTILAPISFCYEQNIAICDYNKRKKDLFITHRMLILCLVSLLTIKGWTMLVNVKKRGMSFSQERDLEAKLLPWQHHNTRYCMPLLRYVKGAKIKLQCQRKKEDWGLGTREPTPPFFLPRSRSPAPSLLTPAMRATTALTVAIEVKCRL